MKAFTIANLRFNPRSHEGSDRVIIFDLCFCFVSIHAPTKGATKKLQRFFRWTMVSIHAPTKGATPASPVRLSMCSRFNPRSHEGSDEKDKNIATIPVVSIHAPTKGATQDRLKSFALPGVSIHAPTKGAT